jgi:hypothetical protein
MTLSVNFEKVIALSNFFTGLIAGKCLAKEKNAVAIYSEWIRIKFYQ